MFVLAQVCTGNAAVGGQRRESVLGDGPPIARKASLPVLSGRRVVSRPTGDYMRGAVAMPPVNCTYGSCVRVHSPGGLFGEYICVCFGPGISHASSARLCVEPTVITGHRKDGEVGFRSAGTAVYY